MSTSARGTAFERRVYEALAGALSAGQLGLYASTASLYKRRSYYSRERQSLIETDLSIEVCLEADAKPILVWVFECKDYQRAAVPVSDIEEFHSKLQQIGPDNTKGTLVTSGALQRAALAFAKASGIGVIRLLPDAQVRHVLYRRYSDDTDGNESANESALIEVCHRSHRRFIALQDERWLDGWPSLIQHVVHAATSKAVG